MGARQRKGKMSAQARKEPQRQMNQIQVPKKEVASLLKKREQLDGSILAVVTSIAMGLVFGFALNKGRVAEPTVIIDQFRFVRWTMMKMFLSAASISCISLSFLSIFFKQHWLVVRRRQDTCINIGNTIIGGMLLGCGMAICGACPGMVLIQVGCGVPNSIITLFGACCGAFIYGIIEPSFRNLFIKNNIGKVFLDQTLNINYTILSFIIGILLMLFSLFIEKLVPWQTELTNIEKSQEHLSNCINMIECRSWSPIIAGIFVGLLQIPCVIILGNTIGGSSGYVVLMGQWLRIMPQSLNNYFTHFTGKLNYWWQVVYVISAIFGSTLAVYCGNGDIFSLFYEPFDGIEGNTRNKAFIGGFIMVFGARLAKGCTSGHGLSGMGLMCTASMIAVASMFAGGGIAGLLMSLFNL